MLYNTVGMKDFKHKLIIAGSRNFPVDESTKELIEAAIGIYEAKYNCAVRNIVSGCSGNIDKLGEQIGEDWGFPIIYCEADWDTHGKAAGPIRNRHMASIADGLILVWDGVSKGSKNMKEEAIKKGLRVVSLEFS